MKLSRLLFLSCAMFLTTGCVASEAGVALTKENESTYIDHGRFVEGSMNGDFNDTTVSFKMYPNATGGKLFYSDIKGKCTVTVRYLKGMEDFKFVWSDPVEVKDIAFAYKAGGTDESGNKQADSLAASFTYSVSFTFSGVNVSNLRIDEITGHMHA